MATEMRLGAAPDTLRELRRAGQFASAREWPGSQPRGSALPAYDERMARLHNSGAEADYMPNQSAASMATQTHDRLTRGRAAAAESWSIDMPAPELCRSRRTRACYTSGGSAVGAASTVWDQSRGLPSAHAWQGRSSTKAHAPFTHGPGRLHGAEDRSLGAGVPPKKMPLRDESGKVAQGGWWFWEGEGE